MRGTPDPGGHGAAAGRRPSTDGPRDGRPAGQVPLRRDLRLVPSATAAWAAAGAAIHGGATAVTAAGLVAAAAALLLACLIFLLPPRPRRAWMLVPVQALPPAAAVALVLLAAGGSLVRIAAGPVDDAVREGTAFTAVLRITGEPSPLPAGPYGGGTRYVLDADVIGGVLHGRAFASATPVAVLGSGSWGAVGTGDIARVLGTAKPADRVGRATAVFLPASTPTIQGARGWLASTSELRAGFRDLASRDDRDGGLLPGMALGDRTGLEPGLAADMKTTGMTHLTAVSGPN